MLGFGLGVWPLGTPQAGGPVDPPPPQSGESAFAYNTGLARSYVTSRPFINLAKLMRGWRASNGASFASNPDAYPLEIPAGASYLDCFLDTSSIEVALESQVIHVRWEGDGVITMGFGGVVQTSEPNHFTFTQTGGAFTLQITDLGTTGVSNVSVVRADHLDAFNAGEIFNPAWLDIIRKAGMLRFLNWQSINGVDSDRTWSTRPPVSRFTYEFAMPFEVIIEVCNQADADLWLLYSHRADKTYVQSLAALVRDTLDPGKKCLVEQSNETWNTGFTQWGYYAARAAEDWNGVQGAGTISYTRNNATITGTGTAFTSDFSPLPQIIAADGQFLQPASVTSDTEYQTQSYRRPTRDGVNVPYYFSNTYQHRSMYVREATRGAGWWNEIHPDRTEHILGAQVAVHSDAGQLIGAPDWLANEPDEWEPRSDTFSGLAVTTYFGDGIIQTASQMTALKDAFLVSDEAMLIELDSILRDPANSSSIAALVRNLRVYHQACRTAGLKLYSYEGGSHIVHFTSGVSTDDQDALLEMFEIWLQSDYCTAFFNDVFDAWKAFGDGRFMQFDAVGDWGRSGAWGAYRTPEYAGDRRTAFLDALSTAGRFWGEDIAPQLIRPLPVIQASEFETITTVRLDEFFTANTTSYAASGLPDGLSIDAATGLITGTAQPSSVGSGTYTITATGAAGSVEGAGTYTIQNTALGDPLAPEFSGVLYLDPSHAPSIVASSPPALTSITDRINGSVYNANFYIPQTGVDSLNGHNVLTLTLGRMFGGAPASLQNDLADEVTLFALFRRTGGPGQYNRLFTYGASDNQFSIETTGVNTIIFHVATTTGSKALTVTPGGADDDWRLAMFRYGGGVMTFTVNGVSRTIGATGDINITSDTQRFGSSASTNHFDGLCAAFFVANRAFNDLEVLQMDAFFKSKYAL